MNPSRILQLARLRQSRKPAKQADASEGFYQSYKGYASSITGWMIAYGIGFPAIALSNDKILYAFSMSKIWWLIAGCFFFGVLVQILYAYFYKWCQWELYLGEYHGEERKELRRYQRAEAWSELYRIDVIADFGALLSFSVGTCLLVYEIQKYI